MAEVWLATLEGPAQFQMKVVVKRIRPSLVRQAHQGGCQVEMFEREALLMARLEHPNIVRVFEFGVEPAARPGEPDEHYLVMERLEGLTLRDFALRSWQANQPLPIELVVRFVADACRGLAHSHALVDDRGASANLVHRDLSPDNIFITRAGVAKLLDFGVAKREDVAALTMAGELKGKVPYMAPEQLTGARLDGRTDIFALGVVLYWLLCGRRPFDRPSDVLTMKAILDDAPPPLRALNPAVPRALHDVVMACLEKERDRRTASAAALHTMLAALVDWLDGPPPDAVAAVAAAEALPPMPYELTPDCAAACTQRWPDRLPAPPTMSLPSTVGELGDTGKQRTVPMTLESPARAPSVRVARLTSRAVALVGVEDDAPTIPPGGLLGSTADSAAVSSPPDEGDAPTLNVKIPPPRPALDALAPAAVSAEPTVIRPTPAPSSLSPSSSLPSPPLPPTPLPPPLPPALTGLPQSQSLSAVPLLSPPSLSPPSLSPPSLSPPSLSPPSLSPPSLSPPSLSSSSPLLSSPPPPGAWRAGVLDDRRDTVELVAYDLQRALPVEGAAHLPAASLSSAAIAPSTGAVPAPKERRRVSRAAALGAVMLVAVAAVLLLVLVVVASASGEQRARPASSTSPTVAR